MWQTLPIVAVTLLVAGLIFFVGVCCGMAFGYVTDEAIEADYSKEIDDENERAERRAKAAAQAWWQQRAPGGIFLSPEDLASNVGQSPAALRSRQRAQGPGDGGGDGQGLHGPSGGPAARGAGGAPQGAAGRGTRQ